jgi:hypothetical protein
MPRRLAWLLAAVALAGPACATFSERRAAAGREREALSRYHYRQPAEVVWSQVRQLLADRGLDLAGKDAAAVGQTLGTVARWSSVAKETRSTPGGGLLLETAWNEAQVRWRAEAEPGPQGLRVVLTRIEMSALELGSDGVALRDFDLEMDLLRRVDPEAAGRIDDPAAPAAPAAPAEPAAPPAPAAAPSRSAGPPGP